MNILFFIIIISYFDIIFKLNYFQNVRVVNKLLFLLSLIILIIIFITI